MKRVLVVDDSPTARELLAEILGSDAELTVVGQAKNGEEALRLTRELEPDVITMDIHMPVMDGFECTKRIMVESPTPIVIVSASTMIHEVASSMKALRAGALTLVRKPPGPESIEYDHAARDLVETVKAMSDVRVVRHYDRPSGRAANTTAPPPAKLVATSGAMKVLAIAASTGGPPAIQRVLSELPHDFALPILIVQHMAAGFTNGFAQWLDSSIALRVKVAENAEKPLPGTVYVASEKQHLQLRNEHAIRLSPCADGERFCPSADRLFQSVGDVFGSGSLAVILTGMGDDGVEGLRSLKQQGGRVIAQDSESSVVFGMPGAAVEAGVVDHTSPLDHIAAVIRKLTK